MAKKRLTKSELVAVIAKKTGVEKKQVNACSLRWTKSSIRNSAKAARAKWCCPA